MPVELKSIIEELNLECVGNSDKSVHRITNIQNQVTDGLTWAKGEAYVEQVNTGTVLINKELPFTAKEGVTYLLTNENAKVAMAKLISRFFTPDVDYYLKNDVEKHRANPNIRIGDDVFIGQNVTIGDGTIVMPQAVIEANTTIGKNCIIKSHVSIGSEGLGVEIDPETDLLIKLPQIGNVIIEDHVDIGPTTTVRRGTLGSTVIKEGAKIGALVNIGHNCVIGRNVILTCNIVTSGSSVLGDYVYVGVNAVIRNGISVGERTLVGMGAVVTKALPENVVVIGNPAKVIRKNNE